MDQPNLETGSTRVAIEFLTLWMEPGDEAGQRAAEHITHVLHEEGEDPVSVIAGQLNLSMLSSCTSPKNEAPQRPTCSRRQERSCGTGRRSFPNEDGSVEHARRH